jgi:hypothetical protein
MKKISFNLIVIEIFRNIYTRVLGQINSDFKLPNNTKNKYNRIYHVHIRKCAGTSVNKAFIEALGGGESTYESLAATFSNRLVIKGMPIVGWDLPLINKSAYFYAFSHLPTRHLRLSNDTFSFTFLRDPIQRVLSHYKMLQDMKEANSDHPALKAEGDLASGDFNHFLKNIERPHLENQLFMFSEKFDIDEALDRLASLSYVGLIENYFEEFIPLISSEFSLEINYKHLRKSHYSFELNNECKSELEKQMASEIEFYKLACDRFNLSPIKK